MAKREKTTKTFSVSVRSSARIRFGSVGSSPKKGSLDVVDLQDALFVVHLSALLASVAIGPRCGVSPSPVFPGAPKLPLASRDVSAWPAMSGSHIPPGSGIDEPS